MLKKMLSALLVLFTFMLSAEAKFIAGNWHNDLRTLFIKNNAVIYTINIRTFGAKDIDGNELIEKGEESGNFLNAIDELDSLTKMGINTIHVLPITPIGKIKAFGTAGSLYAVSSLYGVNPQLVAKKSSMSGVSQAKLFINECHKRNIRVIIDLPSCGSYDMYVEHPEYFVKDEKNNPIVPLDWTDVRLFDSGKPNKPSDEMLGLHKKFIDFVISIGADGIRADVARLKSEKFWKELIKYARAKDSEFLFLAEASNLWNEPISQYGMNTSVEDLFDAGFDGYLGSYFSLKNIDNAKAFTDMVENDIKLFKKYGNKKSVVGSFTTHDEVSPILVHGANFSKMIIWLNTMLPMNSYYVDGFPTGDTYNYRWANKPAESSQTDDEYYFTHKGQIDIFNFSRKPGGNDYSIYDEFVLANKFKSYYASELSGAKFVPLKTSNPKVFAFARVTQNTSVIVFGNLDFNSKQEVVVKVPNFNPKKKVINIRVHKAIKNDYSRGKIKTVLDAGDIQVLTVRNLVF